MSILMLPLDVIGLITGMLEMKELCALRLSCRTMRDRIARTPVVCSHLFRPSHLPKLLQLFPYLSGFWMQTYREPIPPMPNAKIRFLGLYFSSALPESPENLASLTHLCRLTLTAETYVPMGLPKEYLVKMKLNPDCLVSLHLNEIKPNVAAVEYIATLTKLTHLSLELPAGASPALLKDLPLHSLVIELHEQGAEELLKCCYHFREMHTLEVMGSDMRKESRLTCDAFLQLTKLPLLETLRLAMLGVKGLGQAQFSFPRLRAAFLTRCDDFEWSDIEALTVAMPQLYIVHISGLSTTKLKAPPTVRRLQVLSWPGSCVISRDDTQP